MSPSRSVRKDLNAGQISVYSFVKFNKEANVSHVSFPLPDLFTYWHTVQKNEFIRENMTIYRLQSICFYKVSRHLFCLVFIVPTKESVTQSLMLKSKNFLCCYFASL